jgi:tripartite-type tricarboxylate transporter receptor subunit TctC
MQARQIRALGVTSEQRLKQFPDIPAIGETLRGFEFTAWVGCFVPSGTPRDIVAKLNSALKTTLADSDVANALNRLTLEPMHMTPEAFAQRLKADYEKYGNLIRQTASRLM